MDEFDFGTESTLATTVRTQPEENQGDKTPPMSPSEYTAMLESPAKPKKLPKSLSSPPPSVPPSSFPFIVPGQQTYVPKCMCGWLAGILVIHLWAIQKLHQAPVTHHRI